jgi:alginate O-acetyltransferase complex protein AlgI
MIAYGFFKKFVVANCLSEYVNTVFSDRSAANFVPVALACCFNALQLYADFSGYVDIAIGSARFLGIHLDPNFDRPFVSTSVTEFWGRWHMTLSSWLRDYLYLPLAIRIRDLGKLGIVLAMLFTFAICGIWHAATWPFLLFGVVQGVALASELLTKSWRNKRLKQVPKPVIARAGSFYTMGFFVLSQVLFRSVDLAQARQIYSRLFHVRMAGGLHGMLGAGPFTIGLTLAAILAWMGTIYFLKRTTDWTTPWFLVFCAALILWLGHSGSGRFIYAAF